VLVFVLLEPRSSGEIYLAAVAPLDAQPTQVLAIKRDIPYQSLIKVFLAEKIAQERKAS
jgi:hypothetical protein